MTLVLSIQPYMFDDLSEEPFMYGTITIDLDLGHTAHVDGKPINPRPAIEDQLKRLVADGLVWPECRVSVCLMLEQCDDKMTDTSEIVTWFDMSVSDLHDQNSVWW